MEVLSFRFTSYGFLLLCTFWSVADCSTTAPTVTPDVTPKTNPVTMLPPTTLPSVEDVKNLRVVDQTDTSVTITYDKVTGVSGYMWYYFINDTNEVEFFAATHDSPTLHGLMPAQRYNMTLRTKSNDGRLSPGIQFNATTAPENVDSFKAVDQNENSITLMWTKKAGVSQYILMFDRIETTFTEDDRAEYVVQNLNSTTRYTFTLYSEFESIRSTGFSLTAATAPSKAEEFQKVKENETTITLQWKNEDPEISYSLRFNEQEVNFASQELDNPAIYTVPGLQNATRYTFILVTVFDHIFGNNVSISAATAPRKPESFKPVDQSETSITLRWEPVPGITDYILLSVHGEKNIMGKNEETVTNLESGTLNNFSLFTVFENVRSSGSRLTAATVPRDAANFQARSQTETSITLQWDKVGDIQDYELEFPGMKQNISASADPVVTHTVPNLKSGTLYHFTLKTKFTGLASQGTSNEGATVPPRVSSVKVVERNLNTIKLQWESLQNDWEYALMINGKTDKLKPSGGSVSHTVLSLNPGTVYPFNIQTVFRSLTSQPYQDSTVTAIDCTSVNWLVTETSIQGVVDGAFTSATATNGSKPQQNSGSGNEVKFSGLYAGAKYDVMLMYNELLQCRHSLNIVPPGLKAECKNCQNGFSLCVEWDRPSGVWDYVEITVSDKVYKVGYNGELKAELTGFQPAQKYKAFISSQSGKEKSKPETFNCATDARGVIAGSFFGVLLFVIVVCAVVYIMLRRPDIIRRNKLPKGGATSVRKSKGIPLEKFPVHFNEQSADENKGFSLEYEDLSHVGTGQTQKAATAQENRPKNRFINVLPYDQSRVKLLASAPHNDYINASYMPGYNSDREFIAAQGPMPSTVSDFWRMIWEQKVRGIVMVTNCTEGGRTKCEQYWPDSNSRVCGDLAVFTMSQKKETNWTLREFTVKHRHTSEERTVKHFHFTAWPDHGVPEGTEVLIQFRALVRKHIQMEAEGTPTVVHCSAGVGRTGTLIALDMLLQQLERENRVDVNGFVHKMRLNRPHMVQTESQYVFLHQCVLDRLRLNETHEENIYENELIYANATALREYQNNMNNV